MAKELLIENSGLTFEVDSIPRDVRESVDKTGLMVLKGVPASILDEENGNGRKYSTKEMRAAIKRCKESNLFASRRLLCSADDHPTDTFVPPVQASHVVIDAYSRKTPEGKTVFLNDWLVLNTESGKNLQALVEGNVSFGTSIRGLGQINEDTREVEQYEFLGCDAVGNPSAGTFASKEQFKVTVESVSKADLTRNSSQLESSTMAPTRRGNTFDLPGKIEKFKESWFVDGKVPEQPSQDMTRELLKLQMEAVDAGVPTEDIDNLSDEIFGASSTPPQNDRRGNGHNNATHQERDLMNRAQRELEATQSLATHLKTEVEKLEATKSELEKEIKAYQKVSENLFLQIEAIQIEADEAKVEETKRVARMSLSALRQSQKESHDVIRSLEERLETAIRIGDSAIDNAIVLRRIADSLYANQLKHMDSDPSAFRVTRTKQATVEASPSALTDEQRQNRLSHTGNRSGWF